MPSADPDLFALLDDLVDRWCERRALNVLRHILPAYPLSSGLTDEWAELYQTLRRIRSQYEKELPAAEAEMLGEAIVLVGERLYGR